MAEFDNLEWNNINNEFSKIHKEYLNKQEYFFAEEMLDNPEEFYNEMQFNYDLNDKNDNLELSHNPSNLSSSSGGTVSTNSVTLHGISAMGTAVSAIAVCVAAAGVGGYAGGADRNAQETIIQSEQGQNYHSHDALEEIVDHEAEVKQDEPILTDIEDELESAVDDDEDLINDDNQQLQVWAEDYSGIYDGKSHSGKIINVPNDAVITYGESREDCNMIEMPEYTDAGIYTVYYKVQKEGYEAYIGSFTIKIDKKIVQVPSPAIEESIYNGEEQRADLEKSEYYTYSGTISAKDAGIYKIRLHLSDTRNYQWADGNSEDKIVTGVIKPRELTIDWQEQNNFMYDGQMHTIYVTLGNVVPGDFLNFTVKGNRAQKPGTYTAEVTSFGGSENYILPKERSYRWSITG